MIDTIFALSSGSPPAAIGIIRISGSRAGEALRRLTGTLPEPRRAALATVRDGAREALDQALVLWFPAPATATGEDLAEIHCHGGRAVVSAIESALAGLDGLRRAGPGEFTRRAFANGRIDLAEAEGLADLLGAETELQRRAAMAAVEGGLSRKVEKWRQRVLALSAEVEAVLDFADEDDVAGFGDDFGARATALEGELREWIDAPSAERLRDGVRVVFAGPPNSGKSSLFNALLDEGVAIVSPEAGTTRDVIERPVALGCAPFVLVDTAGLRGDGAGEVEAIGIGKALREIERADIVLWLGTEGRGPAGAIEIAAKADLPGAGKSAASHAVSAVTGAGVEPLLRELVARAGELLPKPGLPALNARQRAVVRDAAEALRALEEIGEPLIVAERLRQTRRAFDRLLGCDSTEEMLDALFGRFCIGK